MPPAVAGSGSWPPSVGSACSAPNCRAGIDLAFTQAAVVLAISSSPGRSTCGARSRRSRPSIGCARRRRHARRRPDAAHADRRIPLARGGLGAAAGLSFARGMGEFGATILFAGSFQGVTQTLPLAVYSLFDANLDQAVAIGVLLVFDQRGHSARIKLILRSWTSWTSTSPCATHVDLRLELSVEPGDGRPGRSVGVGQDLLAPAGRRPGAPGRRARRARRRDMVRPPPPVSTCARSTAASGTCRRTTRCFRT